MLIQGTEDYLLPCINKKIFGIECLGCGIQRATVLLFRGEFIAAFKIYPAIYTLIEDQDRFDTDQYCDHCC